MLSKCHFETIWHTKHWCPSLISLVVTYSTLVAMLGSEPLFAFSKTLKFQDVDLAGAALLGLICGLAAMAFSITFRKLRAL